MGLNGKAVLPMVLGLGCDTMATLTTRILPTKKERVLATLLLALGVPCSAQLGVILAMLAAVPFAAGAIWFAAVAGVMVTVGWLAARVLPGERGDFVIELPPMRLPALSNVLSKTVARIEWYLKEALPLFLVGTFLLFLLDRLKLLDAVTRAGEPLVTGVLGLPAEASAAFLIGFLRRDFAATRLFDMSRGGGLDVVQLVVAMVTITLFIPCIANVFMIAKERGWKTAAAMAAFIFPLAFAMGGAGARLHARDRLRRDAVTTLPLAGAAPAPATTCPLCSFEYVPGGDSCREHGCPIALGTCATQHCPRCGYTMPDEERSAAAPLRPAAVPPQAPAAGGGHPRRAARGLLRRRRAHRGRPRPPGPPHRPGPRPGPHRPRPPAHPHLRDRGRPDHDRRRAASGRGHRPEAGVRASAPWSAPGRRRSGARAAAPGSEKARHRRSRIPSYSPSCSGYGVRPVSWRSSRCGTLRPSRDPPSGRGALPISSDPPSASRSSTASGSRVTKPSP